MTQISRTSHGPSRPAYPENQQATGTLYHKRRRGRCLTGKPFPGINLLHSSLYFPSRSGFLYIEKGKTLIRRCCQLRPGRSRAHPPRFHKTMAQVPDEFPFPDDDGAWSDWDVKLCASEYRGAVDIDWDGVSASERLGWGRSSLHWVVNVSWRGMIDLYICVMMIIDMFVDPAGVRRMWKCQLR